MRFAPSVLELGQYVAPAYAGMILAEQGLLVEKWLGHGPDPIEGLLRGHELWRWINHGKYLVRRDVAELLQPSTWTAWHQQAPDIVIDNFRPEALARRGIDPARLAQQRDMVWVSLRSDTPDLHDGRSFDVVAQARSWMEYGSYLPFYVGDTVAGLWCAFKALAKLQAGEWGHYVLGQAGCLQKLVEGELVIDVEREGGVPPWDRQRYYADDEGAVVEYAERVYREPVRDRAWKLEQLDHVDGRIRI